MWSYCNAGFWLLGQFLADRAGSTYEQTLADWVLSPLRLSRTGFGAPEATGHEPIEPGSAVDEPVAAAYPRARNASGGLVSNVDDLLEFARFHLDERRDGDPAPAGRGHADRRLRLRVLARAGRRASSSGGIPAATAASSRGSCSSPDRASPSPASRTPDAGASRSSRSSTPCSSTPSASDASRPRRCRSPAAELALLAGSYGNAELELELQPEGDRLAVEAVEIDRVSGARTPLPPLHARSLGARLFALEGDEWEHARFDFHPRDGAPRFVRFGSRLAERR